MFAARPPALSVPRLGARLLLKPKVSDRVLPMAIWSTPLNVFRAAAGMPLDIE